MQNTWKDQIETPINNLIDDNIYNRTKETMSNIAFGAFTKLCVQIWPFTLIIGGALFLMSFIFMEPSNDLILISALVWFSIGAISGLLLSLVVRTMWMSKARNQLDHVKLFQAISENVTNVSLDTYNVGALSRNLRRPVRTPNIPQDARYIPNDSYTYIGKINDKNFELTTAHWMWVRKYKDNTITYNEYSCGIIVENEKCNDYPVSIVDGRQTISGAKMHKQELENDPFNKSFNVYGDPIAVRKLLNATEQEKMIELQKKFKGLRIDISDGLFVLTFQKPSGFMDPIIKLSHNSIDVDAVVKDANRDFIEFLDIMSYYTCLRKLVR